ncbi:MAG: hypothetical protein ACYSWP_09015 [Planctomycetota bacterium]
MLDRLCRFLVELLVSNGVFIVFKSVYGKSHFEKGCPQATLTGALPQRKYKVQWFIPRNSKWSDADTGAVNADKNGTIAHRPFPEGTSVSDTDWAMKLTLSS